MSLKSMLGLESKTKIRYGIVALGDISQESLMPGVAHTGNSVITALVTGDPEKAKEVGKQYDVPSENTYAYEQFGELLKSGKVDALYIATPNWRHAEFAVPALNAGIHVLLEKPMEVTVAACRPILDAAKANPKTKLMVAYRLHCENATIAAIEAVRGGKVGYVRSFSSTFAQPVDPNNHRATSGTEGGPLLDMGVYPLNAVRNLFDAEPIEVSAFGARHPDSQLDHDFDDTLTVILKFPGNRLAQFTTSYVGHSTDTFTVLGSEGTLTLEPAFGFGKPKTLDLKAKAGNESQTFKPTDHFGGEVQYFSDCILNDQQPEPDGEEGMLDVRVVEAVLESIKTGRAVKLEPYDRPRRIAKDHLRELRIVTPPEPVNASSPTMK